MQHLFINKHNEDSALIVNHFNTITAENAMRMGPMIQGQRRDTATGLTPEMEEPQREKYKMIFDVFRQYQGKITGITFWKVSDRFTWLDGRGRKNFPLLFDMNRQHKKAYWDVVNFNTAK